MWSIVPLASYTYTLKILHFIWFLTGKDLYHIEPNLLSLLLAAKSYLYPWKFKLNSRRNEIYLTFWKFLPARIRSYEFMCQDHTRFSIITCAKKQVIKMIYLVLGSSLKLWASLRCWVELKLYRYICTYICTYILYEMIWVSDAICVRGLYQCLQALPPFKRTLRKPNGWLCE